MICYYLNVQFQGQRVNKNRRELGYVDSKILIEITPRRLLNSDPKKGLVRLPLKIKELRFFATAVTVEQSTHSMSLNVLLHRCGNLRS